LFAGGEYGGAVSLMTEFAPRGKRGLYGAWQSFTVALGLLAGAGIVALLSAFLTPEALHEWGSSTWMRSRSLSGIRTAGSPTRSIKRCVFSELLEK
jgi:MFS family permease